MFFIYFNIFFFLLQTCKSDVPVEKCSLNCNTGTCKLVNGVGPTCVCPRLYNGKYCENYVCTDHCKNHGRCYIDPKAEGSEVVLRCKCPVGFTGDRCEIPNEHFKDHCYNGGTVSAESPYSLFRHCNCKEGYTGPWCRDCETLKCQNNGVCKLDGNNKPSCECSIGYKGKFCEISACGVHGKPTVMTDGIHCECILGFTGPKCEIDLCAGHCQNNGVCRMGTKEPECVCPEFYVGRRCQVDQCKAHIPPEGCQECGCQNDGKCVTLRGWKLCKCPSSWAGLQCEVSLHY